MMDNEGFHYRYRWYAGEWGERGPGLLRRDTGIRNSHGQEVHRAMVIDLPLYGRRFEPVLLEWL
jgi:hypothetical protein